MRPLLILVLMSLMLISNAQDLTGIWEGHATGGANYVRLVLIARDNVYVGYSFDQGPGFCKVNFLGTFYPENQRLKGEGKGFIDKSFGHSQAHFNLKYEKRTDADYLIGTWSPKTVGAKIMSFGMFGYLTLKRTNMQPDTTAYMYGWLSRPIAGDTVTLRNNAAIVSNTINDSLGVINSTKGVSHNTDSLRAIKDNRLSDLVKTIYTGEGNIELSISDNEIVDGDSVTIFHNNEVLASHLFVSATPKKFIIPISKESPHHEIVLVAENLGRIPPNTALLTIEAGSQHYQLKASSDMSRNAVIVFEYRK